MCGLVGLWRPKAYDSGYSHSILLSDDDLADCARSMADAIVHRGPNDAGVSVLSEIGLVLGHRRLSVVDLSNAGHQPMSSVDGRWIIAFNGEIYNHYDLRAKLLAEERRVDWRGHSDTETLLACVAAWGIAETLRMIVGMFAFALYDRKTRRLTLVRDRFGEKPLYYGWIHGVFLFASELKALKQCRFFTPEINRVALAQYLKLGVIPAPLSIYKDVYKLEPGTFIELNVNDIQKRKNKPQPYWSLSNVVTVRNNQYQRIPLLTDSQAVEELDRHLNNAVKAQQLSDVPLGAFLSGGIDSSTIVALMQSQSTQRVKTFTVGFEESSFNEAPQAKAVSKHLGTDHYELRITADDAFSTIAQLPTIYDEPFADSSQIPTIWVCRAAKQRVTVALSGDGGDELFGGYNRYYWGQRIWSKIDWMPSSLRQILGRLIISLPTSTLNMTGSLLENFAPTLAVNQLADKVHKLAVRLGEFQNLDGLYLSLLTEWDNPSKVVKGIDTLQIEDLSLFSDRLLQKIPYNLNDPRERMMFCDALLYLPDDILCKLDRAAMSESLEVRTPFLDHRVAEFAWSLPIHMRFRNGKGKWILRQVLRKYVPEELIDRPKAGFGIPLSAWLRGPLKEWAEDLLNEQQLERDGYFHPKPILAAWREHLSGKRNWASRLWSVLMFQAWLRAQ